MLFTDYLLNRLSELERATRGYGNSISERALYAALVERGVPADEFAVLLEWGKLHRLLREYETSGPRRFIVDRTALGVLRSKANGESNNTGGVAGGQQTCRASSRNKGNGTLKS